MLGSGAAQTAGVDATTGPRALPTDHASAATGASASAVALPWRAIARRATVMWLASRTVYLGLTLFFVTFHPPAGTLTPSAVLHTWQQWDGGWYVAIAQYGYTVRPEAPGFFPLYPLLIHGLAVLFGGAHVLVAALIIANVAALAAFLGVGALAAQEVGVAASEPEQLRASLWAMLALAVYPMAFYLAAPYSEALFLALAVWGIMLARRGMWGWAAACAFLAGLTRPTGLILVPALFWEYGRQHGWWERALGQGGAWWRSIRHRVRVRDVPLGFLVIAAAPLGLGVYMIYLALRFGDPLLYVHAEATYWSHAQLWIWETLGAMLAAMLHPPATWFRRFLIVLDFGALAFVAVVTAVRARRQPVAFTLYSLGLLYLVLSAPIPGRPEVVVSAARYTLVAFPIYLALGEWGAQRKWWARALLAGAALVQMAFLMIYLAGSWVE